MPAAEVVGFIQGSEVRGGVVGDVVCLQGWGRGCGGGWGGVQSAADDLLYLAGVEVDAGPEGASWHLVGRRFYRKENYFWGSVE